MSESWILSGKVTVKAQKLSAYRRSKVATGGFTDWPDAWGVSMAEEPVSVARVLTAFGKLDGVELKATATGFKLLAQVDDSDDGWVHYAPLVVCCVRAAASFGGHGTIDVSLGKGATEVFRFTANADGTTGLEVLQGDEARAIGEKLEAQVEKAFMPRYAKPTGGLTLAADVAAVHKRVCAALREAPREALEAAVKTEANTHLPVPNEMGAFVAVPKLFPTAAEFVDALERGWNTLFEYHSAQVPPLALRLLGQTDPARSRELAAMYVSTSASGELRDTAEAASLPLDSEAEAVVALERMRARLPEWRGDNSNHACAAFAHWFSLRRTAALTAVAWRMLRKLTGVPGALLPLPRKRQVLAHTLSVIVAADACGDDLLSLFRLWTDSPNPDIVDLERLASFGPTASAYLASLYGRAQTSPCEFAAQEHAFEAALAEDPEGTLAKARTLASRRRKAGGQAEALRATLSVLSSMPGPPAPEWIQFVRAFKRDDDATEVLEDWGVK